MLPPDLAQVVEQYHRALEAYVAGDADPVMRLFSRREDVTLANPLGPPVRGWERVDEAARRAGAQVREGEDNRFERISEFATGDLGYIVEIHRARAKLGGPPSGRRSRCASRRSFAAKTANGGSFIVTPIP